MIFIKNIDWIQSIINLILVVEVIWLSHRVRKVEDKQEVLGKVIVTLRDFVQSLLSRRALIFKRKNNADNSPKTEKVVPNETNYPKEKDFYSIALEEYGGLLPIHSVGISFVLPYDDWCEFEKSNLYRLLQQYLLELQKRDNLHVKKALED